MTRKRQGNWEPTFESVVALGHQFVVRANIQNVNQHLRHCNFAPDIFTIEIWIKNLHALLFSGTNWVCFELMTISDEVSNSMNVNKIAETFAYYSTKNENGNSFTRCSPSHVTSYNKVPSFSIKIPAKKEKLMWRPFSPTKGRDQVKTSMKLGSQ